MLASIKHSAVVCKAVDQGLRDGLLADEDVIVPMQRWQRAGQRVVLATLVGVEGGAPRQAGSQMAIAEDGNYVGYLSGGCLERAVALEALAVLEAQRNRLVRYGRGSMYFDVRLPCDSGLDIYFDQSLETSTIDLMARLHSERRAFTLTTSFESGSSNVSELTASAALDECQRGDGHFVRVYAPRLRLFILGQGPAIVGIARLAASAGIEISVSTQDDDTKDALQRVDLGGCVDNDDLHNFTKRMDLASAVILCFHEHEKESEILAEVVKTPSFYIGAMGSRTVHRRRLQILTSQGLPPSALERIKGPIGSIAAAKSTMTLAIGALADICAEAKRRHLIF